jgi:hypothetical protein
MRLTRVLKNKVEQELKAKLRQDYLDRKKKAIDEIKEYLMTIATADIQNILTKYNMDTDNVYGGHYSEILMFFPQHIENAKEWKKIKKTKPTGKRKRIKCLKIVK